MIDEEGRAVWIDGRESNLRVLAASSATIVVGWAVFAASQIPGSGERFFWAGCGFSSLLWCGLLVVRALGRARHLLTWLLAGHFVLFLPFLVLACRLAATRFPDFALTGGNLALGIVSTLAFAAMTVAGCLLERRPVLLTPRRSFE